MQIKTVLKTLKTYDDKEVKPYWNERAKEFSDFLWVPAEFKNYDEVTDEFFMDKNYTKSTPDPYTIVLTNKDHVEDAMTVELSQHFKHTELMKTFTKTRIYPKSVAKFKYAFYIYMRAYNLAIRRYCKFRNNFLLDIHAIVQNNMKSWSTKTSNLISEELISLACDAAETNALRYFSKTDATKIEPILMSEQVTFRRELQLDSLNFINNSSLKEFLGEFRLTQPITDDEYDSNLKLVTENNRCYIVTEKVAIIKPPKNGNIKYVALDPGNKNFITTYSDDEVIFSGVQFSKEKLLPLFDKVKTLLDQKQEILKGDDFRTIWRVEKLRSIEKKIKRIKARKKDLVTELHNVLIKRLVDKYDVIFLPEFQVFRKNTKQHSMSKELYNLLMDLDHRGFKQKLKWKAFKEGKHVVDCNESFTTKTYSWNGFVNKELGADDYIYEDGFMVNRDINGARGILIRQLSL